MTSLRLYYQQFQSWVVVSFLKWLLLEYHCGCIMSSFSVFQITKIKSNRIIHTVPSNSEAPTWNSSFLVSIRLRQKQPLVLESFLHLTRWFINWSWCSLETCQPRFKQDDPPPAIRSWASRSVPCSTDRPGQPTTMSENLNTITTTTLIHKSKLIFGIFDFSFS
jgi:hypothetical protein